jgi:hypothetical protein
MPAGTINTGAALYRPDCMIIASEKPSNNICNTTEQVNNPAINSMAGKDLPTTQPSKMTRPCLLQHMASLTLPYCSHAASEVRQMQTGPQAMLTTAAATSGRKRQL